MKKSPKIDLYEFEFWPSADDKLGINQRLAENIEIKYSKQDQHPEELWIENIERIQAKDVKIFVN